MTVPKGHVGPCQHCGQDFLAKKRDRNFCSVPCSARHAKTQRSYTRLPVDERFWKYVTAGDTDECWEWQGYRDHHGYGRLSAPGGNNAVLKAHRVSYEIHSGPIPDGLNVLHGCDNPPCVNPNHLRVGTQADNAWDMVQRGRARAGGRYIHPDALVAEVRRAVSEGMSCADAADLFGVKERWVRGVVSGERRVKEMGR